MLKTIKIKKQMRLDELIKYVWDNDNLFKGEGQICFEVDGQKEQGFVCFENNMGASFSTSRYIELDETFTVEVEEEIDYGTVFEEVYRVTKEGYVTSDKNKSIDSCLDWKDYQVQIFAMLDGRLQLIWEEDVN